jgi:hypothetical protein
VSDEAATDARPAFYALERGGWRDYVTLLHPPYTLWHLSYVVVGASLAPRFHAGLLGLTLIAFFLALGIGAHALDEFNGRPLRTEIPDRILLALALVSVGAAAAIGIVVAARRDLWLLALVGAGCVLVAAYNLELFGGVLHGDLWFGLAWGAFPLLTAYFASARELRLEAIAAAAFATLLSLAQRYLSTQVRDVRRRVASVSGTLTRRDGSTQPLTAEMLTLAAERALRALTVAVIALALALVLLRVT